MVELGSLYHKKQILKFLNHKTICAFSLILVLIAAIWLPHNSYATDQSGNVKWELIFLSPYGGCTNYQYQMANVYDEITSKYFELYQFANSKYPPQCMPDKKYANYTIPSDLDLIILVYDDEIGKKELRSNQYGGFYSHVGADRTRDHTIIFCDCSNFGYSDPTWTLSHELSHFITYYLGFDISVVENGVESMDSKFDKCVEGERDVTCSDVVAHLRGDHYFTDAVVMAPYAPAIGKKIISSQNTTVSNTDDMTDIISENATTNTSTYTTTYYDTVLHDIPLSTAHDIPPSPTMDVTSDASNSQNIIKMQKEITKWWLAGQINDTEYAKVLKYTVDKSNIIPSSNKLPTDIILADGPDGHEKNATSYSAIMKDKMTSVILKRIPFKPENNTTGNLQIPQWFKSKAGLWSNEQNLTDNDFVNGINYLFGVATG